MTSSPALFFVGLKNRVNLVLFFKPFPQAYYTVRRNASSSSNQLRENKSWDHWEMNDRAHTKFPYFLLLSYLGMLTRIKICYTVVIRMCCICLCKYLFLIYSPDMSIKTACFQQGLNRMVTNKNV